jgi:hypothetical protein
LEHEEVGYWEGESGDVVVEAEHVGVGVAVLQEVGEDEER